MTNPATPAPKGGMPKWLIILLVIFLIIGVGCCGGFVTCTYLVKRGAAAAGSKFDEFAKQAKEEMEKARVEAEKQAAEEAKRAAEEGTSGTPAPATPGEEPLKAVRMPATFPTDLPKFAGMVPTWAMSDKTSGSGSVIFRGTATVEAITAYYEKEMAKSGWSETSNNSINDSWVGNYKKDQRQATVMATPDGKMVQITITYSKE